MKRQVFKTLLSILLALSLSACGGLGFSPAPLGGGLNPANGTGGSGSSSGEKKDGSENLEGGQGNDTSSASPGGGGGPGGGGAGGATGAAGVGEAGKGGGDTGGGLNSPVIASSGGTVSSSTTTPDVGTDDPCFRSPYGPELILEHEGQSGGLKVVNRPDSPFVRPGTTGIEFGDQVMRVCDVTGLPTDPSLAFQKPTCLDSPLGQDGGFSIPDFNPGHEYFIAMLPKDSASGLLSGEDMLNLGQAVRNCQLKTYQGSPF